MIADIQSPPDFAQSLLCSGDLGKPNSLDRIILVPSLCLSLFIALLGRWDAPTVAFVIVMFESEELLHRIFCDPLPPSSDAAYLFGQTPDNQDSVFKTAQELVHRNQTHAILIPGTGPMSGYPGQETWSSQLAAYVAPELIQPIPTAPTDSLNTLIEAQATVRYAKAQNYRSLLVVAAPFHQQRAVMTLITVALLEYPQLKVYSAPGQPMDWQATVVHSQGLLHGKGYELIYGELERIEKYAAKGDLSDREGVLAYLRQRDARSG